MGKKTKKKKVNRRRLVLLISYLVFCLCVAVLAAFRPFNVEKVKKVPVKKAHAVATQKKKTVPKRPLSVSELRRQKYPQELIEFVEKYPETAQFVTDYKTDARKYNHQKIDISHEVRKGTIPLFIQWDKRWGYRHYGGGFFATKTCGPTCMSMVYSGLTGKTDMDPYTMSLWSYNHGYYENGVGTRWVFLEDMPKRLGLDEVDIRADAATLRSYLKGGWVCIANVKKGDFTKTGHYIVIKGLSKDGKLLINDPNSPKNSRKKWNVYRVTRQTRLLAAYRLKKKTTR